MRWILDHFFLDFRVDAIKPKTALAMKQAVMNQAMKTAAEN